MRAVATAFLALALIVGACGEGSSDEVAESAASTVSTVATTAVARTSPTTTVPTTTTATTTTAASTTTAAPVVTMPPTTIWAVGPEVPMAIMVDEVERGYTLVVPSDIDPVVPLPLVIAAHGLGEDAVSQRYKNFHQLAETEGIVVAYPQAIMSAWDLVGVSDVEFFKAMVADIAAQAPIDLDRVYVIGYSMGGALAAYLSCHAPGMIAAIASVAILQHHDPAACPEPKPTRLLALLGRSDRVYTIERGIVDPFGDPALAPKSPAVETADWASTNGCGAEPTETMLDEGTVRHDYTCAEGALTLYFHDGGHIWPLGTFGIDANRVIWDFLKQYTAPISTG